jgi:hypothetical protein
MSEIGLHHPFGHPKHKLWPKERPRVKLAIWLPITKSRESTQFPCVQVTCHIPLESSRWELKLFFRPHINPKSVKKVMGPKIAGVLSLGISGLPLASLGTKGHLDVAIVEKHRIYYKGEGGGFPQVRAMVSLVSPSLPMVRLSTKSVPTMH